MNKKGFIFIAIQIVIIIILVFVIYYLHTKGTDIFSILYEKYFEKSLSVGTMPQKNEPPVIKEELIPIQQINNVGFTFYLANIDYPNSVGISDEIKNSITQIIIDSGLSRNLSKDIIIVMINTLAVSSNQYFNTPVGKIKMIELPPIFLKGGGVFSQNVNNSSFIFINKNLIAEPTNPYEKMFFAGAVSAKLKDVLTHELGHFIGSRLTIDDWRQYYKLRQIPSDTPLYTETWVLSPGEDFADVYRKIFTKLEVRTYYGLLARSQYLYFEKTCGGITSNIELQDCRREVLLHPEKYPEDWRFGTPYYSAVDQATKDFIRSIINKLNLVH